MSIFSEIFNTIVGGIGDFFDGASNKPQSSGGPGKIAAGAVQPQQTGTNWGGLIGDVLKVAAPFITANVVKPNKPVFPKVPDSVKNDPRVQQLIGPYGGYDNAPYTKPLSPFQIAFGTTFQNLLYDPAPNLTGKDPSTAQGSGIRGTVTPTNAQNTTSQGTFPGSFQTSMQGSLTGVPEPVTSRLPINYSQETENNISQYAQQISDSAAKYGVDPLMAQALAAVESDGRSSAISPKGAGGLFQIMPGTANDMADRKLSREELLDTPTNIDLGVKYLAKMLQDFNGDYEKAISAYNAGPAPVRSGAYKGYKETREHRARVLSWYNYLKQRNASK